MRLHESCVAMCRQSFVERYCTCNGNIATFHVREHTLLRGIGRKTTKIYIVLLEFHQNGGAYTETYGVAGSDGKASHGLASLIHVATQGSPGAVPLVPLDVADDLFACRG